MVQLLVPSEAVSATSLTCFSHLKISHPKAFPNPTQHRCLSLQLPWKVSKESLASGGH